MGRADSLCRQHDTVGGAGGIPTHRTGERWEWWPTGTHSERYLAEVSMSLPRLHLFPGINKSMRNVRVNTS